MQDTRRQGTTPEKKTEDKTIQDTRRQGTRQNKTRQD